MAASPTDGQLLTAQAIQEYSDMQPCNVWTYGNGTAFEGLYGGCYKLPANDDNCYIRGSILLPLNWRKTSATLYIYYAQTGAAGTYSVKWYVSRFKSGETASSWNVLSASTAYDFAHAGVEYKIATQTINLTTLEPGDRIGFLIMSDALNDENLYVLNLWVE